jgi:myosin heavy subunit
MSLLKKAKDAATAIQSAFRGWTQRKTYKATRQSLIILQAYVRRQIARRRYINAKNKIIMIQTVARSFLHQKAYLKALKQILTVQALVRRRKALKRVDILIKDALIALRKSAVEYMVRLKLSHHFRAEKLQHCEQISGIKSLVLYKSLLNSLEYFFFFFFSFFKLFFP